ncbi:hypothetical protein NA57DRAFT_71960 [Rhizodiscina lignyota]|uniref:Actin-like ATPase domain-containing protein n=1 Tax=Rhizodiscina lignyota TaxID=1504668 RepID=A0A9P4INX4_9PEZI|nr:hypothetical protein NA57DRAFT_71960 [Rhizodiscina lignyota]
MERPRPYRLIGIDLGTTFSGAAWAWSERIKDKHELVMKWEGLQGQRTSAKVPTQILYKDGEIRWGFNIPPDEKPLRFFKLLLLEKQDMKKEVRESHYVKEAEEMIRKLNKTPVDVVADYLKMLWEHTKQEMINSEGRHQVEGQPFLVVITFPAIWPYYAQDRMKQAATAAGILDRRHGGMTRLELCPEPEAAALAVMDDSKGHLVDEGEAFVVCDVGGGTADLITYQMEDTTEWRIAECVSGDGELCAGVALDEIFRRKILEWVPEKKLKRLTDTQRSQWLEDYWELGLKRSFNGDDKEWELLLPIQAMVNTRIKLPRLKNGFGSATPRIHSNTLVLWRSDVVTVFDPVIEQILHLIKKQIEQTYKKIRRLPKAILLVGGFGQSPYLLRRVQDLVRGRDIEIRQPTEHLAWSAICRGALQRASILNDYGGGGIMRANIASRVSRLSYGIVIQEPFDENRHMEQDRRYQHALDIDCAMNQMQWYLRKGEDISDKESLRFPWKRVIGAAPRKNQITILLMKCADDDPPTRCDDSVQHECNITCTVRSFEDLPSYNNEEGEWREIYFDLEMKVNGPQLEFTAYHDGRRQISVRVNPPFGMRTQERAVELWRENGGPSELSSQSPSAAASDRQLVEAVKRRLNFGKARESS